jgi:hypothetical protein
MCERACVNMCASVRVRACAIVRSRWGRPTRAPSFRGPTSSRSGREGGRQSAGEYSQVLTGAQGCPRVLTGTHGYSQVLTGAHGYSRVLTGTHRYSPVQTDAHAWAGGPPAQAGVAATDNSNATESMRDATCNLQHAALRLTPRRALRRPAGACHLAYLRAHVAYNLRQLEPTYRGEDLNALGASAAPTDTPSLPVPRYPRAASTLARSLPPASPRARPP